MDEERRLFYVGITRAKKRLQLLYAFRRSLWGGSEVQELSRFVNEIPDELLSGKIDHRARKEAAYKRESTWGDDSESSGWGKPTQPRNPYNWSQGNAEGSGGKSASSGQSPRAESANTSSQPKTNYWSPAGNANGPPDHSPFNQQRSQYRPQDPNSKRVTAFNTANSASAR